MKFLISNLRLLARRFKAVAIINIVGLGVAFAVMLVVAMQVRYDLSYDRGFKNSRDIFRMEVDWSGYGGMGFMETTNYRIPELWKSRVPEVRDYSLVGWADNETFFQREGGGADAARHNIAITEVTSGFLSVFTPEIVAGNAETTFDIPGHVLISERAAAAIFGVDNPVGQVLTRGGDPADRYIVDAVYRDFAANSSITNGLFTRTEPDSPGNYNWRGYLLFDPADHNTIMAKISDSMLLRDADDGRYTKQKYALTGANDYYLHGSVGEDSPGNLGFTTYLLVIGLVILAVAIINFVNLSMAMAPSRVRGVNIHRILGIGRGGLRASLSMEAVVMAAVAVVAGCLAVHRFSTSVFTDFFSADLTLENNIPLVALCAAGLLAVAFLVGVYSSNYATSFDVAIALKSSFALSRHGAGLRNSLIVVQFTTAVFFICFSTFVWLQYRHMSTYSPGFDKENIVCVPAMADSVSRASFAQELAKDPRILDYTTSSTPGYLGTKWGRDFEGKEVTVSLWRADHNTLKFFGVKLLAGEDFSPEAGRRQLIVNREFLRKYDFSPEDVIGKSLEGDGVIVGVSEDVNFESLHKPIVPMVFSIGGNGVQAFIKIAGEDVPATLAFIEKTWNAFPAEAQRAWWGAQEWSLDFLDERMDALYKRELGTSRLIAILGMMAVAIAVMGMFGLIMFNTRYKTREIAIRKVNGASVGGIALMLNRNMLILVGVGFALAVPLTLVFIMRWVEGFAYKAAIPWWLFPAGGLVVLLVAVATVSRQSWKAATANPVNALKSE
jgi:putative ABC transport system permease protein